MTIFIQIGTLIFQYALLPLEEQVIDPCPLIRYPLLHLMITTLPMW